MCRCETTQLVLSTWSLVLDGRVLPSCPQADHGFCHRTATLSPASLLPMFCWTFKLCSHKTQRGKNGSTVVQIQATGDTSGEEPACQCRTSNRLRFSPWFGTIPWRREWQPAPVFLPGESHRQRSLAGYSPWGHKESDVTEATTALGYIAPVHSILADSVGKHRNVAYLGAIPHPESPTPPCLL